MKFADNTGSTALPVTIPGVETGQMNKAESITAGSTLAVQSEQPAPAIEDGREDLTTFFAVGIVINIVMITAYFVWAFKQWNKTETRN
jgi:heme/copper-type cytochrome/quinol oxidase subunit 2